MGSNIEPQHHLRLAAAAIRSRFPTARFSRVYRSPAVGMVGDDFLNACCQLVTTWSQARLVTWLKRQEDAHGRDRSGGAWQPRTLDLDLLCFDGRLLDAAAFAYAHVALPAAELQPDLAQTALTGKAEVVALVL